MYSMGSSRDVRRLVTLEVQWMCENYILRTSFQQPKRFSIVSFKDRPRANRGAFLQIGFLISGHRGVAQGRKFFSPNSIGVFNQLDCNQSIHQCKKHYRLTRSIR
ncbi:hypothetical protein OUZ56_012306 [Daphnia magna]|uniref:Uncharacterized protein n=1 Tax=Daphnia magna TaxID=35525 RepID=A0ABQ9Z2W7_9CRUS|nr:hypothetical protein OUZ56_012306 [Daphnia magna]